MVGDGGIEAIAGAFSSIPMEFDTESSLGPDAAAALGRTLPELEGLSPELATFEEVIAFIGDRPRHFFALQYVDDLGRGTRAFFDPITRPLHSSSRFITTFRERQARQISSVSLIAFPLRRVREAFPSRIAPCSPAAPRVPGKHQ